MINWADRIEKIRRIYDDPASSDGEREAAARKIVELTAKWEKAKQESARDKKGPSPSSNRTYSSPTVYNDNKEYPWKYYEHQAVSQETLVSVGKKTYIDFTTVQAKATDRQMQFIVNLCKRKGFAPPKYLVTFDCASEFIEFVRYR